MISAARCGVERAGMIFHAPQAARMVNSVIPVAVSGTEEESQANSKYRRSLTNDDSVKTFLKTIHRSLKENA